MEFFPAELVGYKLVIPSAKTEIWNTLLVLPAKLLDINYYRLSLELSPCLPQKCAFNTSAKSTILLY